MSVLFTINLQNVSARLMISVTFTKIKVNYETGGTLRKNTTVIPQLTSDPANEFFC